MRHTVRAPLAATALFALISLPASAQTSNRTVTVQAGGFNFDFGGDATTPMAALRADWKRGRYLRTEIGVMGARPGRTISTPLGSSVVTSDVRATLFDVDVSVQAEAATPYVQPYVGIGLGLFGYFEPAGGDRFFRPTNQVMAGIRAPLGERLGIRAELRARFDQFQSGGTATDMESTLGLSWHW